MEKQPEQQEIEDIIANREEGYGYQLKVARNDRNLTTADIARELRLDEKMITALEGEDQTSLPEPAFVCGYIRNYARLLNIQPEPLVEYYKREYSSNCSDPELKISRRKGGFKGHTKSGSFMAPVMLLVTLALVLFGGWHLWKYISSEFLDKNSHSLLPIAVEQSEHKFVEQEDPALLSLPEPDKNSYQSTPSRQAAGSVQTATKSMISETEPAILATESTLPNNNKAESSVNVSRTENNNESLFTSADNTPDKALTEAVSTADKRTETVAESLPAMASVNSVDQNLHLQFRGDSWIVIKDATGKKLATGLKRAGQTLNLKGQPPYHLFLGNGRVVDVSIHGKKYDLSRYINDKNIARFSVK